MIKMSLVLSAILLIAVPGCSMPKMLGREEIRDAPMEDLQRSFAFHGSGGGFSVHHDWTDREEYLQALRVELADRSSCDERTRQAIIDHRIFVGMPKWAAFLSWGPWATWDETRYRTAYSDTTYVNLGPPGWQEITFDGGKVRNWFVEEH